VCVLQEQLVLQIARRILQSRIRLLTKKVDNILKGNNKIIFIS